MILVTVSGGELVYQEYWFEDEVVNTLVHELTLLERRLDPNQ